MFDSLFGGRQTSKCKQFIKIINQRLERLRNEKRENAARLRSDVAGLLKKGRHKDASFRVELLYREENVLRIYDMIEMYCEHVRTQLSLFQKHRTCPQDIKEAISSIIYAAARCTEIPELQALRGVFATKYGDEFAVAAVKMSADSGVNAKMVESFNAKDPSKNDKLKLMKEIAGNAGIPWTDCYSEDASATQMSSPSVRELKSSTGCSRDMHEKDIPCLSSSHNDKSPSPNHMRRGSEVAKNEASPMRSPPGRTVSMPEKSPALSASQAKLLKSVSDVGVLKPSHVHPKLPDYDDLTAHFAALKQQCKSSRQGQSG